MWKVRDGVVVVSNVSLLAQRRYAICSPCSSGFSVSLVVAMCEYTWRSLALFVLAMVLLVSFALSFFFRARVATY